MHIKNIKLTNYRNYKFQDLILGRQTTIFIGKNGAGKTNMISAMKQALSFVFRREKDTPQFNFIASLDQKVKSFEPLDPRWGFNGIGFDYCYPVAVAAEMEVKDDAILQWSLTKLQKNKGLIETSYAKAANEFWSLFSDFKGLPIFAYFSDAYPHVKAKMGKNIQAQLESGNPLPRNDAYYKWDEYLNCDNIWMNYFTSNFKNTRLGSAKGDIEYVALVKQSLIDFSKPLKDAFENKDITLSDIELEARGEDYAIVFRFENGKTTPYDMLPMGLRRIFSIVFDIANRSYILNKDTDPEGMVFIDEVDLHLHPSIAQEILERLRRSFPKMQFIVSTHSPLVLSNFKQDDDNIIYQLYKDDTGETVYNRLPGLYGIDYNSLLVNNMETPVRNSLLQELRDAYIYWKRENDKDRMDKVLKKIISRVGEDSAMVKSLRDIR